MVGSLPRGMSKVVDYRQIGAQATNEMMMQDRNEVLSRFGRRERRNTYILRLIVLLSVNEMMMDLVVSSPLGDPYLSLYSLEG